MTLATGVVENLLKALKNEAPSKYEEVFVKLHTGDPGAAGTTNAAAETTRKKVTLTGTTVLKNSAAVEWAALAANEEVKWVSIWTAATAGTFLGRGELEAPKALEKEGNAKLPAEGFSISVV